MRTHRERAAAARGVYLLVRCFNYLGIIPGNIRSLFFAVSNFGGAGRRAIAIETDLQRMPGVPSLFLGRNDSICNSHLCEVEAWFVAPRDVCLVPESYGDISRI